MIVDFEIGVWVVNRDISRVQSITEVQEKIILKEIVGEKVHRIVTGDRTGTFESTFGVFAKVHVRKTAKRVDLLRIGGVNCSVEIQTNLKESIKVLSVNSKVRVVKRKVHADVPPNYGNLTVG